eukprot:jgi/Chrzof1/14104/Cz08g25080.t1
MSTFASKHSTVLNGAAPGKKWLITAPCRPLLWPNAPQYSKASSSHQLQPCYATTGISSSAGSINKDDITLSTPCPTQQRNGTMHDKHGIVATTDDWPSSAPQLQSMQLDWSERMNLLESQLAAVHHRVMELQQQQVDLQAENTALATQVRSRSEQQQLLTLQLAEAEQQHVMAQLHCEQITLQLEQLQQQHHEQSSHNEHLVANLDLLHHKSIKAAQSMEALSGEKDDVDNLNNMLTQQVDELTRQLQDAQAAKEASEKQQQELQRQLVSTGSEAEAAWADAAELRRVLQSTEKQVDQLTHRGQLWQEKAVALEQQKQDLLGALEGVNLQLDEMRDARGVDQDVISELEGQKGILMQVQAGLKDSVRVLEGEREQLLGVNEGLKKAVEEANVAVEERGRALGVLQQQADVLRRELGESTQKLTAYVSMTGALQKENLTLKLAKSNLENHIQDLEASSARLQQQMDVLAIQRQRLLQEHAVMASQAAAAEASAVAAQSQAEAMVATAKLRAAADMESAVAEATANAQKAVAEAQADAAAARAAAGGKSEEAGEAVLGTTGEADEQQQHPDTADLQLQFDNMCQRVYSLHRQLEELKLDKQQLTVTLRDAEQVIADLQSQLQEKSDLQLQYDKLCQELYKMRMQLQSAHGVGGAANDAVDALTAKHKADLAWLMKEHRQEVAELNAKNTGLADDAYAARIRLAELEEAVWRLQSDAGMFDPSMQQQQQQQQQAISQTTDVTTAVVKTADEETAGSATAATAAAAATTEAERRPDTSMQLQAMEQQYQLEKQQLEQQVTDLSQQYTEEKQQLLGRLQDVQRERGVLVSELQQLQQQQQEASHAQDAAVADNRGVAADDGMTDVERDLVKRLQGALQREVARRFSIQVNVL